MLVDKIVPNQTYNIQLCKIEILEFSDVMWKRSIDDVEIIVYLFSLGPLPSTFNDFWRMVWEKNCSSVVMLTNLQERHKVLGFRFFIFLRMNAIFWKNYILQENQSYLFRCLRYNDRLFYFYCPSLTQSRYFKLAGFFLTVRTCVNVELFFFCWGRVVMSWFMPQVNVLVWVVQCHVFNIINAYNIIITVVYSTSPSCNPNYNWKQNYKHSLFVRLVEMS